jgi:hypothetical protein
MHCGFERFERCSVILLLECATPDLKLLGGLIAASVSNAEGQ